MAAFLLRGQLVFEMDSRRPCFYHSFHQLEAVQWTAKPGLRICNYWDVPVYAPLTEGVLNLVGSLEGLVDPLHKLGNAVGRVEALVGISVAGKVGISRDLPAAHVDGLEPRLDHLQS